MDITIPLLLKTKILSFYDCTVSFVLDVVRYPEDRLALIAGHYDVPYPEKTGITLDETLFLHYSCISLHSAQHHCRYSCTDPENFLSGVQIPRRGLTENFNMAKINNLAIPGGSGPPVPPPPPPSGSAHVIGLRSIF